MVIAGSDRGIVLIGADHTLFRAYHHDQTAHDTATQPFLWVEDIDGDSRSEYIGAGNPSFVVDDNGDPMWGVAEGCDSYYVADFVDDATFELLCVRGASISVWSYDGQEYLTWEGRGYSISGCTGDDFDDDRKFEVACALTDGNHMFLDVASWFNDPDFDPMREGPPPEVMNPSGVDYSGMEAVASGAQPLTVNGRQVTLGFAAGALTMTAGDAVTTAQIGGDAIYSATSADLDSDGVSEIYVGGTDAVYIVRLDGTVVATIAADPNNTEREAVVTVRSATANGLEDSDREVVGEAVNAGVEDFTSCYANRMGSDQFTRVGTMLYELTVSDSGRVTNAAKRHSGLRNSSLEGCIEDALEDLRFSEATNGTGTVSLTLGFDFVDR